MYIPCSEKQLKSLKSAETAEELKGGDDRLGSLQEPGRAEQPPWWGRGVPGSCAEHRQPVCVYLFASRLYNRLFTDISETTAKLL